MISKLQAQDVAQCFAADAFVWLKQSDEVFDVIFIDPPFALSLHQQAVQAALPHLKEDGFIYLENESEISDELLRILGTLRLCAGARREPFAIFFAFQVSGKIVYFSYSDEKAWLFRVALSLERMTTAVYPGTFDPFYARTLRCTQRLPVCLIASFWL